MWANVCHRSEAAAMCEHQITNTQILDRSVAVNGVDQHPRADETLHRIGDENLVARELDRLEHLREELAGTADERQALGVLVGAGPLADDDQVGLRVAGAEDDRVARLAQLAVAATLQPRFLRPQRLGRRLQEIAVEGQRLDSEVAMKAEGGG